MTELKPCPFCGSEPRIMVGLKSQSIKIYCSNMYKCGATQEWFEEEKEARDAWNRRVGDEE